MLHLPEISGVLINTQVIRFPINKFCNYHYLIGWRYYTKLIIRFKWLRFLGLKLITFCLKYPQKIINQSSTGER